MRARIAQVAVAVVGFSVAAFGQGATKGRLNPLIELLQQKKAVFGLYAPTAPRTGNRAGAPGAAATPPATPTITKTPLDLAKETLAYAPSDFVFSGSMEGNAERALPAFAEDVSAMEEAGALIRKPALRLPHPLVVKTQKIAPDPALAIQNISHQLNTGVSTIVQVGVESAEEVRQGLAAMRFKSKGGTRLDDAGSAPAYWGMTEKQYRDKADVWPLNPKGELLNWTIVESKEGLAHIREIAAVKGISVLLPGAGTLRGVFSTTGADGRRVADTAAWEAAIQQVLAACKEFKVPCGYPATADDIEMRLKQGFSVFIMNWGDAGFKTIDIGRRAAGR